MAGIKYIFPLVLLLSACGTGGQVTNDTTDAAGPSCQALQCFGPIADGATAVAIDKLPDPVIRGDAGFELPYSRVQAFGSIVHRDGVFRMSYTAKIRPESDNDFASAYAESHDGLTWAKHGVILDPSSSFSVLYDDGVYRGAGIDNIGTSTDMKTWDVRKWPEAGFNDTSTSCVKFKGDFLCYVRNQGDIDGDFVRLVALTTSTDWETWTEKENIIAPTTAHVQPYGLQVAVYGDRLVGVLWWYYFAGTFTSELIWSDDGRTWHRTGRELLGPTPGTWDQGFVAPAAPVFVDGMAYFYYTGCNQIHDMPEAPPGSWAIGLAMMPEADLTLLLN